MKNFASLFIALLILVIGNLIIASCTQEVTKTLTVTTTAQEKIKITTPVTKTVTIQNTVTTTEQGTVTTSVLPRVTTPVFDGEPPEIPHSLFFSMPGISYKPGDTLLCFECHSIPPLHEGWLLDTELCDECHPVSDMPFLEE